MALMSTGGGGGAMSLGGGAGLSFQPSAPAGAGGGGTGGASKTSTAPRRSNDPRLILDGDEDDDANAGACLAVDVTGGDGHFYACAWSDWEHRACPLTLEAAAAGPSKGGGGKAAKGRPVPAIVSVADQTGASLVKWLDKASKGNRMALPRGISTGADAAPAPSERKVVAVGQLLGLAASDPRAKAVAARHGMHLQTAAAPAVGENADEDDEAALDARGCVVGLGLKEGTLPVKPEQAMALLLSRARTAAEKALRVPSKEVTLCVPGAFDDAQRVACRRAAWCAGMRARRLVSRPLAALVGACVAPSKLGVRAHLLPAKGSKKDKSAPPPPAAVAVLVVDVGALGLDVAVLSVSGDAKAMAKLAKVSKKKGEASKPRPVGEAPGEHEALGGLTGFTLRACAGDAHRGTDAAVRTLAGAGADDEAPARACWDAFGALDEDDAEAAAVPLGGGARTVSLSDVSALLDKDAGSLTAALRKALAVCLDAAPAAPVAVLCRGTGGKHPAVLRAVRAAVGAKFPGAAAVPAVRGAAGDVALGASIISAKGDEDDVSARRGIAREFKATECVPADVGVVVGAAAVAALKAAAKSGSRVGVLPASHDVDVMFARGAPLPAKTSKDVAASASAVPLVVVQRSQADGAWALVASVRDARVPTDGDEDEDADAAAAAAAAAAAGAAAPPPTRVDLEMVACGTVCAPEVRDPVADEAAARREKSAAKQARWRGLFRPTSVVYLLVLLLVGAGVWRKVSGADRAVYKERLTCYYRKHAPDRVYSIDSTLEKWNGREYHLFQALKDKYGYEVPSRCSDIDKAKHRGTRKSGRTDL